MVFRIRYSAHIRCKYHCIALAFASKYEYCSLLTVLFCTEYQTPYCGKAFGTHLILVHLARERTHYFLAPKTHTTSSVKIPKQD
jgi:hypothetical protein